MKQFKIIYMGCRPYMFRPLGKANKFAFPSLDSHINHCGVAVRKNGVDIAAMIDVFA